MKDKALKKWLDLSDDIRNKILNNVWCPQCITAVRICDYSVEFDNELIVLQGFCGICGHKVARLLENCTQKPKKTQKCALEYYIFDIWIAEKGEVYGFENKVLRKIQIAGTKTLYNFAKVITQAFNFYFDHCFGFYNNFQRYHDSTKAYELFVDIGEEPLTLTTKGVKRTKIRQVFKKPGEKMLFLFDYGDCWYFVVELREIKNAEEWDLKPVILESVGEAPIQYPPPEEDLGYE